MKKCATQRLSGRGSERGIALILTLAILVIVTLLVVAFAISMRVENTASKNFNDLIKARQIAQAGVDQAVATLGAATPPAPPVGTTPTISWAAAPGVIYGITLGGVITRSNLYTDTAVVGNNGTVDLNANFSITGNNSFYFNLLPTVLANASITCAWQNVISTNVNAPKGEVVGRFAYWTDVESAKVNINLAEMRTASSPTSTFDPLMNQSVPGDVDLRALEVPFYENPGLISGNFSNAHANPPTQPLFSTVEDMRRGLTNQPPTAADGFITIADNGLGGYTSNQFYITVGGPETNTDAFGRDRVDLTAINSDTAPAWMTALASFGDPSWGSILYPSVVAAARNTLVAKYGNFGAAQILANIADYQVPYTTPSVGNANLNAVTGIPNLYSGLKKGPMIDDVIVHVATNAVAETVNPAITDLVVYVFVDTKLVNGYELVRGANYQLKIQPGIVIVTNTAGVVPFPAVAAVTTLPFPNGLPAFSFGDLLNVGVSPPGFTYTVPGNLINNPPVATGINVNLSYVTLLSVANTPANIVDWMDPSDFTAAFPGGMTFAVGGLGDIVPFNSTGGTTNSPNFLGPFSVVSFDPIAMGKQDPRVRTLPGRIAGTDFANAGPNLQTNWFALAGSQVVINGDDGLAYSSRISPEVYNLLADQRSIEPNKPTPSHMHLIDQIAEVPFRSVGELGYIHTGYPWRTLRLRSVYPETSLTTSATPYTDAQVTGPPYTGIGDPNLGKEQIELNALPDWITLDMFKVGPATTIGGRININTEFSGDATNLAPRLPPLIALIDNSSSNLSTFFDVPLVAPPGGTGTNVDAIAGNIVNRVLVPNLNPIVNPYAVLPAYLTPGEICETEDLGYFSDTVAAVPPLYRTTPSKTRREQLIRRIANLITTRSSTFTIWCIAQSIKDVDKNGQYNPPVNPPVGIPTGNDFITGEVKIQAIVQRYEDTSTTPTTVKFRTLYYRYLYN